MKQKIIIYGSGGHAGVIIDIIKKQGQYEIAGLIDDDEGLKGKRVLGCEVLGPEKMLLAQNNSDIIKAVVGIGDNKTRRGVVEKLFNSNFQLIKAIHPSACIGGEVEIGPGSVIMANAVVNSGSVIGENVIINTSTSVDHDCRIGNYVHVCPGVNLGGGVSVGDFTLVGIGSSVLPSVRIGSNVIIGAGSVVTRDIPDNVTAKGVPARFIRPENE